MMPIRRFLLVVGVYLVIALLLSVLAGISWFFEWMPRPLISSVLYWCILGLTVLMLAVLIGFALHHRQVSKTDIKRETERARRRYKQMAKAAKRLSARKNWRTLRVPWLLFLGERNKQNEEQLSALGFVRVADETNENVEEFDLWASQSALLFFASPSTFTTADTQPKTSEVKSEAATPSTSIEATAQIAEFISALTSVRPRKPINAIYLGIEFSTIMPGHTRYRATR